MADRSWLGFGGRARTPQPAQQSIHPEEHNNDDRTTTIRAPDTNPAHLLQRAHTEVSLQKNPHKAPRLSRFSSLMGLNGIARAHSPSTASFEIAPNYPEVTKPRSESVAVKTVSYHEAAHDPSTGIWRQLPGPDKDVRYRESDFTWHNPNLRQMIETIQCTIMTNGISAPIPCHLNSFVAGMIEEFAIQMGETKALQNKIMDLEETRAKEREEFRETTNEWQEREREFKLEINRLEHIISDTQKGAESVVLARAESVCNRNDGRAFRAKLNRLSRSEEDYQSYSATTSHDASQPCDMHAQPRDVAGPYLSPGKLIDPHMLASDSSRSVLTQRMMGLMSTTPNPESSNVCYQGNRTILAHDAPVPVQPTRNSNSTTASSASGPASSASSGLVIAQRTDVPPQHYVTPGTTPILIPVNASVDHVKTLRELLIANGGLPENAIEDDNSPSSPVAQPRHAGKYSFDEGDDRIKDGNDMVIAPEVSIKGVCQSSEKRPQSRCTEGATGIGQSHHLSNTTQTQAMEQTRIPQGSSANRSTTLLFMGRNHVARAHSNSGDGRDVVIPGYTTPTRKAQSGQDPFPSQETIQIARQQRTTHNTGTNGGSFYSDKELGITNRETIRTSRAGSPSPHTGAN